MPNYHYRCSRCSIEEEHYFMFADYEQSVKVVCPQCGYTMERVLSFAFHRGMSEHYNPTVGRVVKNSRDFHDELKRASEAATIRTGIPHNYQPIDIADLRNEATKEASAKRRERLGQYEAKKWL